VICRINMNPEMAMGEFLKKLSPELMSEHVSARACLSNVPLYFPMPYIYIYSDTAYMVSVIIQAYLI
jgi:hypothetical protein